MRGYGYSCGDFRGCFVIESADEADRLRSRSHSACNHKDVLVDSSSGVVLIVMLTPIPLSDMVAVSADLTAAEQT